MLINTQNFPISAIVVCLNEAKYLNESLSSLSFCDEIIFADMGSSDNSIEIARIFTDHIVSIPRVQYVELVLNSLVNLAHNDWIISHDPDEVISPILAVQIQQAIDSNPDLASIHTPIRFYFRGKLLRGTIWGGNKYKNRVFNRKKVQILPYLHRGINLLADYKSYHIPFSDDNYIEHYWIDSYKALFVKHWRYIKNEGETRYTKGYRFSIKRWITSVAQSLYANFITHYSLRDGFVGIFLSIFYAWYIAMSELSLLRYQILVSKRQGAEKS